MKNELNKLLAVIVISMLMASCTHQGEPNKQGDLLSLEQIKALENDQSMNGKLVTVEGYAGVCSNSSFVVKGKKNEFSIYKDGFCQGNKLINAQIKVDRGDTALSGEKPRNHASFSDDKNLTDESIFFMTDDYQEVKNSKLKFSGKIFYDHNNYHLNNVTIHR